VGVWGGGCFARARATTPTHLPCLCARVRWCQVGVRVEGGCGARASKVPPNLTPKPRFREGPGATMVVAHPHPRARIRWCVVHAVGWRARGGPHARAGQQWTHHVVAWWARAWRGSWCVGGYFLHQKYPKNLTPKPRFREGSTATMVVAHPRPHAWVRWLSTCRYKCNPFQKKKSNFRKP
jgi:hypothetical protein